MIICKTRQSIFLDLEAAMTETFSAPNAPSACELMANAYMNELRSSGGLCGTEDEFDFQTGMAEYYINKARRMLGMPELTENQQDMRDNPHLREDCKTMLDKKVYEEIFGEKP